MDSGRPTPPSEKTYTDSYQHKHHEFQKHEARKKKPKLTKIDTKAMKSAENKIRFAKQLLEENKLDEAMNFLEKTLKGVIIPAKTTRSKPWFDADCSRERNATLQALPIAKSTKEKSDLERYAASRRKYKAVIKEKKQRS